MIDLDAGGEEFVFENDWDTAVPITVRKKDGKDGIDRGEIYIEVFPTYEAEAREFAAKFSADPFAPEALAFIWERIGAPMAKRGYSDEKKFRHRWYHCYVIHHAGEINTAAIMPETVRLTRSAVRGKKNRTTFDLPRYISEEITSFVTVRGGEVVSIAAENMSRSGDFDDDADCRGVTEIGVETAVGGPKWGFASSCAASLAKALIAETGGYVTYETDCDNIPSQKVAERAGFVHYGRCYYYVMRKIV